jgi:pre-mRNA-processing factor 40
MQKRVYDMHIARLKQIAADDARRAERKRRHRIDDLRYALKGVSRHIELDMKFEEAVPFMEGLKEWGEVKEEEGRREAFERFIRRQKVSLCGDFCVIEQESMWMSATREGGRREGRENGA